MVPNVHLTKDGELFGDPEKYRRLIEKLNYLMVICPDIAYPVSVVSQFMASPTVHHWAALEQILCHLKRALGCCILYANHSHSHIECFSDADWAGFKVDRRSTSGYCVFVGGNLISWKSKKQNVLSRSSAESEYRAMAQAVCQIMWIYQFLTEIGLETSVPAKLWCDNQAALHIASNLVFHERTKHIEIDCHFVREKLQQGLISIGYVKTGEQLGDIFTKALIGIQVDYLCNKLDMIDIYTLT
ncbi:secreted RxLR effector protein 161-like [Pistacia vera]|uniref:secreted RxLR effector protein 161-like n=1 Tax=Pistacia vera TaxID=55513 RepID=UPI001262B609|nr:secreted RxLR effector protein 161-like [Pistacia vera]